MSSVLDELASADGKVCLTPELGNTCSIVAAVEGTLTGKHKYRLSR